MFSRIHQKLGTAGLVVAIFALVVALTGVAVAAGGLSKPQEKQVIKIAKKYAGKKGATGPVGPAGPAGAKGDAGAPGANGKEGAQGATGATGKQGLEGSPWTAGGVLPSGQSETGAWAIGRSPSGGGIWTAISFNIPLAAAPEAHYFGPGEGETTECPGTAASPEAEPGQLCIYAESGEKVTYIPGFSAHVHTSGATLFFGSEAEGFAQGTWAVTAP